MNWLDRTLQVTVMCTAVASAALAQSAAPDMSGPRTLNPAEYPFPDSTDAAAAAPGQHSVIYEDENVRLVEVTYRPHELGDAFHGHPRASVFAFPSARPQVKDTRMDPNDKGAVRNVGTPPPGLKFPSCTTMGVQFPHRPENLGDFPDHFYRIEFKRLDGDAFKERFREWYPYLAKPMTLDQWLMQTGKSPVGQARLPAKASTTARTLDPAAFPYPDSYDSIQAAPGQHWLRFENANIRMIEVMYRPGEKSDAMHGHPYPSVFALASPFPGKFSDELMEKGSAAPQTGGAGAPPGMQYPLCWTMGPQAPHVAHNQDTFPIHFYRIEFKRIDGEDIKTRWREWYPGMVK